MADSTVASIDGGGSWNRAQWFAHQMEAPKTPVLESDDHGVLREKFQSFVAGTFYRQLLESMRKTVQETKLVHGGRAEEIFRAQLDQNLSERLADSHGSELSGKMYEQFLLGLQRTPG